MIYFPYWYYPSDKEVILVFFTGVVLLKVNGVFIILYCLHLSQVWYLIIVSDKFPESSAFQIFIYVIWAVCHYAWFDR